MQVFAQSLSPEVSLTLIRDDAGWRFSHWSRCTDDAVLPKPPAPACARSFDSPAAGGVFFRALLVQRSPPSVRDMILLGHEAAVLKAGLADGADGLDARWQSARRKLE